MKKGNYTEALRRDPEYTEAWYKLALEISHGRTDEDTIKEILEIELFKDEPTISGDISKNRALINAGVFCFDKVISKEPENVDAWYEKGLWHDRWMNSSTEQIECFLKVTELVPKHKSAWHYLANAYSEDHEYEKALDAYDKAIASGSYDLHQVYAKKADLLSNFVTGVHVYRGTDEWMKKAKKKFSSGEDALKLYDSALEKDPKYGYALYKKGILLEELSRYEEALECFEAYSSNRHYGYYTESENKRSSNTLHRQIIRDKINPDEDGSDESCKVYCDVIKKFLEEDRQPELQLARKKLNENLLMHHFTLNSWENEDYDVARRLGDIGRVEEALEAFDKIINERLEEYKKGKESLNGLAWMYQLKEDFLETLGEYRIGSTIHNGHDKAIDCSKKIIEYYENTNEADGILANEYSKQAYRYAELDVMDKAIEHIDRAIEIENSGNVDDEENYWVTKLGWISDEEAIKFLDEQIKNDCDPDYYIPEYLSEKITILKRLGKNEESKKIQKDLDKLRKSIKEKEEMEE